MLRGDNYLNSMDKLDICGTGGGGVCGCGSSCIGHVFKLKRLFALYTSVSQWGTAKHE
jgi:hypothetical protein